MPLLLSCFLVACSSTGDKDESEDSWPVARLYSEARGLLEEGEYARAITFYNKLEARFPFGKYAQQALLDTAYAHYLSDDSEQALSAANRFLKFYPQNPHVDYVWYLKGLVHFNRGKELTKRYLPTDESQRDPQSARLAFEDLSVLVRQHPNSDYVPDARSRMRYLRNTLARHEVNVANYYMRRGAFVAAANRARYAVENYPRTPVVADALALMARAYKVLELDDLYDDVIRVLQINHPEHPSLAELSALEIVE